MLQHALTLLLGFTAIAAASPMLPRQANSTCVSGLYMIVARGSMEPPGEGDTAEAAKMILAKVPNSVGVALNYPAEIIGDGVTYPQSVSDGITNTIKMIESYVDKCGDSSKIALLGYSQGGNVMTDVLAGGVDKPAPLSSKYKKNIVGVAVFGDPTYTVSQTFDAGNATQSGIFAREGSSLALLKTYSSVLRSYCMDNDFFCDSGDSLEVHYNEVATYAQAATDFIVGLVQ